MSQDKTLMFREAPIPNVVMRNAVPSMVSMLMVLVYNLADTFFIGLTNNDYMVAAVSFALPVFMIPMALGNLFGAGGTTVISQAKGRGEDAYAKKVSSFCFWAGLAVGVAILLVVFLFAGPISRCLGATSENTFGYTRDYLAWVSFSAPLIIISNAFASIVRAEGKAVHSMAGMMIGNLANVILDPIFIFALDMGVVGAAIATVIGNALGAGYYILLFLMGKSSLSISPKDFSAKEGIAKNVIAIGTPSALSNILMSISNIVTNALLVGYGDLVVAGFGVANKVRMVLAVVSTGFSQGIQPLLGYCYGAGLDKRFRGVARFSLIFSSALCILVSLSCIFGSETLAGIFLTEPEALAYGKRFTMITMSSGVIYGLLSVMQNALQAMGQARDALIISLSRQGFIYFPMIFILNWAFGMTGLAFALPVADVLATCVAAVLYRKALKHKL